MNSFSSLVTYNKLKHHFDFISKVQLKELFAHDSDRFDKYSIRFNEILLDYSKNIINQETIEYLVNLAEEAGLKEMIGKMFSGSLINFTERRAVLHTALRSRSPEPVFVNNMDIMPEIELVKDKMKKFSESVHSGEFKGFTGKKINTIVNIGIGGSDLGPAMVCEALKKYSLPGLSVHFISNVDSTHIYETLRQINPETTLFIIASKTFTTQETITNANTAKNWFLSNTGNNINAIRNHFIALSTNEDAVVDFGIDSDNIFGFWDWVGGRYSLWSAVGMSIMLYLGEDNFEELLTGAWEMDVHFRDTPFEANIPVILGLLGIWYSNFFETRSHAIIPYDQYLDKFPLFLQQLDMESNGKYITRNGNIVDYNTGPIIWGTAGTNSQHSFFQLIHQGTHIIPVDFIAAINPLNEIGEHHEILISNCFAQSEALMTGKSEEDVKKELQYLKLDEEEIKVILPHKIFQGNRPSNTILMNKLNPRNLGSIIAMYEHKVFVQGVIWNINSFDQWGVELGKQLAKNILPELRIENNVTNHDCSTNGLINYYKKIRLNKKNI